MSEVEVVALHEQPALAVRRAVPLADLDVGAMVPVALGRLGAAMAEQGLTADGAPYARYAEFGPERADVELGFPLTAAPSDVPALEPDDEIGATSLPGGEAASYRHVGSYDRLVEAYQAIEAWLREHDRSPSGAPWESYVVAHDAVDDPERLETLVFWPLEGVSTT